MDLSSLIEADRTLFSCFNGSDSLFLDGLTTTLTSGFTWIPLYMALLYLIIKNNETVAQIFLIVACSALCILLADGMADIIVKPLVGRWRPGNDPVFKYTVDVVNNLRGDDYGFFSAHAANTMSLAVYFCLLVRNRVFQFFMILWSLINCWTRLYLGLHYPGDVLVGLLWGIIAGFIAYLVWHKVYFKISPKLNYISSQYTSTGYSLTDIDVVIAVMVFTFAYAIIRSIII